MRFCSFEIKNFKGIEHTKIDLAPSGANIFTLIGLNESGKTTILEALSSFSIYKEETGVLYGVNNIKIEPTSYVPKHLKANFTGEIIVKAVASFDDGEKDAVVAEASKKTGAKINKDSIPDIIEVTRGYKFENSDYKTPVYHTNLKVVAIPKGSRKERECGTTDEIRKEVLAAIIARLPRIVYFPTFLFALPEKIILNPSNGESAVNKHYRQIIADLAGSLKNPLNIQTHIVDRIVNEETISKKIFTFWGLAPDKRQQVDAALNEMSAHLTETVFNSWAKIFGGDFTGREIVLQPGIDVVQDQTQQVYLQFILKDGKTNYDIAERSLGFRWFFSFLLFTLYRVMNQEKRATLFLLDEPASNLHSKAQMQLLESLPKISVGSNQIIYSTHSHYLINPEWLDQAFIVSNQSIDYESLDESTKTQNDRPANIQVDRYRNFVGRNPDKTTYFQPILDKLDVAPSKLDLLRPSVLVEGKGDYLILEYGRRVLLKNTNSIAIVPTRGAMGMEELVGLFLGWCVTFAICLDDDKEGKDAQKKYIAEWGLNADKVKTLVDVHSGLAGKSIEGFLEAGDLKIISDHFQIKTKPSKSQVQLFFSEKLAKKEVVNLSKSFLEKITAFDAAMQTWLSG